MNAEAPGIGREYRQLGRSGVVRRESFDPEWPKSIGIKPRNADFGVQNGSFEVNKPLVTYFAIFNGSFDATKPSHRRTKAARMTQEVIRIRASTSWLTTNTVVKVSFLAVSVDLRALPGRAKWSQRSPKSKS